MPLISLYLIYESVLLNAKSLFLQLLKRQRFNYKWKWKLAKEYIQKVMLIKNLSKSDYYKSRNIPIPKPVHKLTPQPSVRSHLLEPIATMAAQIKRHIENRKNIENKQLEHMGYEQALHELQVKMQDLNRLLANKQDQITGLVNQKQKDQRRLNYLEKQVFDFQAQLQKVEYEYKSTIEYLKAQNYTQKSEYRQRILSLQDQLRKAKQEYDISLNSFKESYNLKIQSYSGSKETFKLVSEQLMNGLKKDIEFHLSQNKRLKNQLILSQKYSIEKLKYYQQQNHLLREKIQHKQLEYSFQIRKNNSQIDSRNLRIEQLNQKVQQLSRGLQNETQKFIYERQYVEKSRNQREEKWRQTMQETISQKRGLQAKINKLLNEINQSKDLNNQLQRKYNEASTKLSFIQFQKQQTQSKYCRKIQELKDGNRITLENQLLLLKKSFQQKINIAENNLEDKNNQINILKENLSKMTVNIQQKNSNIKVLEEKQRSNRIQIQNKIDIFENITKENNKLKRQVEATKQSHRNQTLQLKKIFNAQRVRDTQQIKRASNNVIVKLREQISQTRITHEQEIKSIRQQIQKKAVDVQNYTQQINRIYHQKQQISNKYESLNSLYQKEQIQHRKYAQDLKRLIEDQAEALKKNAQNMQQVKNQYSKTKFQLEQKQSQLQKSRKQVKQARIQQDQLRLQSIRKCSQIQQQTTYLLNQIQKQNHQLSMNIKKSQGQLKNLQSKLQHANVTIKNLQSQKEIYLSQNQRLKQTYTKKQQTANNLLNELNVERRQMTDRISQDFREKIVKMQIKNQGLIHQVNHLKQANLKLTQDSHKNEIYLKELENKISEKNNQIQHYHQQLTTEQTEFGKLQQKVIKLCTKMLTLQTEKNKFQTQNEILVQRVSKFQQSMMQMKKSNIYDSDLMQDLKSRNNRLLIINEQQRMEIEFQITQKQNLKAFFKQVQKQLQLTNNQLNQLKQSAQKIRSKQEQQLFQIKVKQIRQDYQKKNRELFDKILLIQEKVVQKDQQLANVKKITSERDQILSQLQEKQNQLKKLTQRNIQLKADGSLILKQLQSCTFFLGQRENSIAQLKIRIKQIQQKRNAQYKQLQMNYLQLQTNLNIVRQKLDSQLKRNDDIKTHYEIQLSKFQKYKGQCFSLNKQIDDLKGKLRLVEQSKEQVSIDLRKQYEQLLNKHRIQRQQVVKNISEQYQKNNRQLKKQISDLNDQKLKVKNQFLIYKTKNDQELAYYQGQSLVLQQTINKLKRNNEYLFEYKKRWDKISGQVKQYQNLDSIDVKQIDLSYNQSMKSSIIIEKPFFPKFQPKQGPFSEPKNFLQTPQTTHKQTATKKSKYRYQDIDKYQ